MRSEAGKSTRPRIRSELARSERAKSERALIGQIRARTAQAARPAVRLGIGDDCALLRVRAGEELAVTTDLSIAGRHFRLDWHSPEAVGHRTLARGLSDLAAMGARPVAAFLSLGLPTELVQRVKARSAWRNSWMDRFLDGFLALANASKTPLAGGDLAESTVAVADIVLIGAVARGKALLRCGARPGDLLYVTGSLGGAALGIESLAKLTGLGKAGKSRHTSPHPPRIPRKWEVFLAPHLYPQPRLAQGLWLSRRGRASAAIDLSDGLSTDLGHLCAESGVSAEVDAARLPIHPGASLEQALHGGEDYELLFTAAPGAPVPRTIAGVPVTRIGRMVRARAGQPRVALVGAQEKQPLEPRGWEHFSQV